MKFKALFFIFFSSATVFAQGNKTKVPDSLIFTGKHFSVSGLCGYSQPVTIREMTGPRHLGNPLNTHYNFGLALTFWQKKKSVFYSIGLKMDLWFYTYRLNIMKNASNNLLWDMNEHEKDYFVESYYYYFETGRKYNLGRKFFAIPFLGLGLEYVHPMEATLTESQTDGQNRRILLYYESSNKEIPRFHIRAHAGIGLSYILPYGHIVSLRLVGSCSNGMIGKGHYILLPGTPEESTGTYDLHGNYAGIDLVYTFTGTKKKKMALNYSDKKYKN